MSIKEFLSDTISRKAQDQLISITRNSFSINGEHIIYKPDLNIIQNKISEMNKRIKKLKEKNRIPQEAHEMEITISLIKENPLNNDSNLSIKLGNNILKEDDKQIPSLRSLFSKLGDLNSFMSIKLNNDNISQLTDWIVLGLVSKVEDSNAYTLSTFTEEPLPEKYKDIHNTNPCLCEHCETNRQRNNTFILKNQKTEEILQVGASCMKSFIDEKVLNYFFSLDTNELFITDEEYTGGRMKYTAVFDKEEYLAVTSAYIRRKGSYKSARNTDHEAGELTTNKFVMYHLDDYLLNIHLQSLSRSLDYDNISASRKREIIQKELSYIQDIEVNDYDREIAKKVIEDQKSKTKEEVLKLNEFEFNMYSILTDDTNMLIGSAAPRVAYSVANYIKQIQIIKEQELVNKLSGERTYDIPFYFGEEKQRIQQIELKLVSYEYKYDDFYRADNHIMKFKTLSGQDVYIKHSGSEDSLSASFIGENGFSKDPENINEECAGKYVLVSGSISQNTDFLSSNNNKIINTKIGRIKMLTEFTEEPSTNGEIILNEKYSFGDLKVTNIELSEIILGKEIKPNYKYTFEDKSGKQYSMISSHEFEAFEKNKNVRMIFQQGYQDLILPTKKERIKVIPELEIDVTNNLTEKGVVKMFSPKEVKKKVKPS